MSRLSAIDVDDAPSSTEFARAPARRGSAALALLCLATFIAILDYSITTVPLPQIQRDLGFSDGGIQWVVNGYGVTIGGFLLLGGRIGDVFGRRRAFVVGLATFGVGSVAGGLAPTPELLIAARAVQGLGAALFTPAAIALLSTIFPAGARRDRALGAFAAIAAAGLVSGLILGGLITEFASWRWVLWVTVPLAVAGVLAAPRLLVPDPPMRGSGRRLDIAGATLVTGSLGLLVYALARTEESGFADPTLGAMLVVVVAGLITFVAVEHRSADPLVPIGQLLRRTVGGANLVALFANMSLGPVFVLLALLMQGRLGLSPIETGYGLLPMAGALVVTSAWVAPRVMAWLGSRTVIVAGMVALAAGQALLAIVATTGDTLSVWALLPGAALAGAGYGLAEPAWFSVATNDTEERDQGLTGGLLTSGQEVGAAAGLAILTGIVVAGAGYPGAIWTAAAFAIVGTLAALMLPAR